MSLMQIHDSSGLIFLPLNITIATVETTACKSSTLHTVVMNSLRPKSLVIRTCPGVKHLLPLIWNRITHPLYHPSNLLVTIGRVNSIAFQGEVKCRGRVSRIIDLLRDKWYSSILNSASFGSLLSITFCSNDQALRLR